MNKNLLFPALIALSLATLASCREERDGTPQTGFTGEWIWVESVGGFGGWTENPQTENETRKIEIDDLYFKSYVNDVLVSTAQYDLSVSGMDTLITYDNGNQQFVNTKPDELILSDLCADCFTHRYRRR